MPIRLIVMGILMLINSGLAPQQPAVAGEGEDVRISGELVSFSIGYTHMTRFSAYSYSLTERGGEILFSCYFFDADDQEVNLENIPVDPIYMVELREIAHRYGFTNIPRRIPRTTIPGLRDAPMPSATITLLVDGGSGAPQRESVWYDYHPHGSEEILELYRRLAEQYR